MLYFDYAYSEIYVRNTWVNMQGIKILVVTDKKVRRKKEKILAQRLECSPMARETWVQSQVESYQRL